MIENQRKLIILEFEKYLNSKYEVKKEVVFNEFLPTKRRFRADYLLNGNIVIEINGGQWSQGRHNRGGKGYENDLIKINIAQLNKIQYYQFTYEMINRLVYKEFI